jgi:hypothetical protein
MLCATIFHHMRRFGLLMLTILEWIPVLVDTVPLIIWLVYVV